MPHYVHLTCSETKRVMAVNLSMALSITALDEARTIIAFGPSFLTVEGDVASVLGAPTLALATKG